MKRIIVKMTGTREYWEVNIPPGSKSRDVLSQLKLDGFQLCNPDGPVIFDLNDDLYPEVKDGQKIFATRPLGVI